MKRRDDINDDSELFQEVMRSASLISLFNKFSRTFSGGQRMKKVKTGFEVLS